MENMITSTLQLMQKVAYNNNFYLLLYATAFCFGGDSHHQRLLQKVCG